MDLIEIKHEDGRPEDVSIRAKPEGKLFSEVFKQLQRLGWDGVLLDGDGGILLTETNLLFLGRTYTFRPLSRAPERDSPSKKIKKSLDEFEELNDQHAMSRFVTSLLLMRKDLEQARHHSGFVIRLLEDVLWMGSDVYFSNELFVRRSYNDLREAHYTLDRGNYTLFTSTPGIDKSHLAALMVAEFLIDGRVVLLEVSSLSKLDYTHEYYRLQLCEDGSATVHRTCNMMTILKALEELVGEVKGPVYLVDGGYPNLYGRFSLRRCENLIFGSPREEYMKLKTKDPSLLILYVPLFDEEELLQCAKAVTCFKQIKETDIRKSFAFAGGVARTVLRNWTYEFGFEKWKALVEAKINYIALKKYVDQIGTSSFPPGSDAIFHWIVPSHSEVPKGSRSEYLKKYKRRFLGFASPQVASRVCLVLGMREIEEIAKMCMQSSHQMTLAALRGYWFEHLAHMKLLEGGTF